METKIKCVCIYVYSQHIKMHSSIDNTEIIYATFLVRGNLVNLVTLSVKGDMDGSNGELVFVNGSNGQVVALWLESSVVSGPGQSESLAFWRNPVGLSFVGVTKDFLFDFLAVRVDGGHNEFLLRLRLFTGCSVRSSIAIHTRGHPLAIHGNNNI